jgi:lysophospholipase L1-like esterase
MKLLRHVAVALIICLYLYVSYTGFYNIIGNANLKPLFIEKSLIINNPLGQGETQVKYVALGDSLSAGVGSLDIRNTFVYQYASNLSEKYKEVQLINLAISGGTTTEVINYQLAPAIQENPDYVTLLIGTNDIHNKRSVTDFRDNFQKILNELLTKTTAQITVINIPYLGASKVIYPPFNFLLNYRTQQFNKVISGLVNNVSDSNRVKLVDLYNKTYAVQKQDQKYYSSDFFHPSDDGYIFWGQMIDER